MYLSTRLPRRASNGETLVYRHATVFPLYTFIPLDTIKRRDLSHFSPTSLGNLIRTRIVDRTYSWVEVNFPILFSPFLTYGLVIKQDMRSRTTTGQPRPSWLAMHTARCKAYVTVKSMRRGLEVQVYSHMLAASSRIAVGSQAAQLRYMDVK